MNQCAAAGLTGARSKALVCTCKNVRGMRILEDYYRPPSTVGKLHGCHHCGYRPLLNLQGRVKYIADHMRS